MPKQNCFYFKWLLVIFQILLNTFDSFICLFWDHVISTNYTLVSHASIDFIKFVKRDVATESEANAVP